MDLLVPDDASAFIAQKAVVLDGFGTILLLKRSDSGAWSLPGGGLIRGEDPVIGIEREVREETTLAVSDVQPFFLKSYVDHRGDFVLLIGYRCTRTSGDVTLNEEHTDYRWCTIADALALDLTSDGRAVVERYALISS